jgi:hypothetical protein
LAIHVSGMSRVLELTRAMATVMQTLVERSVKLTVPSTT